MTLRLARRRSVTNHRIYIKFWNNIPVIAKIFFLVNSKSENLKIFLISRSITKFEITRKNIIQCNTSTPRCPQNDLVPGRSSWSMSHWKELGTIRNGVPVEAWNQWLNTMVFEDYIDSHLVQNFHGDQCEFWFYHFFLLISKFKRWFKKVRKLRSEMYSKQLYKSCSIKRGSSQIEKSAENMISQAVW